MAPIRPSRVGVLELEADIRLEHRDLVRPGLHRSVLHVLVGPHMPSHAQVLGELGQ